VLTQAANRRRPHGADAGLANLRPDAALAIRLLAEQGAIPVDQMARFLGCEESLASDLLNELASEGWLGTGSLLTSEPPWAWLSRQGLRRVNSGFAYLQPRLIGLAHRRAINQVRLHLQERAPHGRWVCERTLRRRLEPEIPIPDGVFEISGERHAIEIELSCKSTADWRLIIGSHSARYDAVVYICGPRTRRPLERLQRRESWPKLVVRELPGMAEQLAAHARGIRPLCPDRPRRPDQLNLAPCERRVLRLISEQGAVPLDQLAAFLGRNLSATVALARRLSGLGLANLASLVHGDTSWIWLTNTGSQISESGFRPYRPSPGSLEMVRANNAVRLQTEAREPRARWICWRTLRGGVRGSGQVPHAVVEIGAERHAIELDTGRRQREPIVRRVGRLSARYDAAVVFCPPRRRRLYESLRAQNHWPNLVLQRLPDPSVTPSPFPSSERSQPSLLSDELWQEIDLLLSADGRSAMPSKRRRLSDRSVVCGLIFLARRGGGLRHLPQELGFGSGNTCNERLRRWRRLGIWPAVQRVLEMKLPDGEQIAWSSLEPRSVRLARCRSRREDSNPAVLQSTDS
jgi:transposase/Mn-dependent DtxR family transcriptional regulator